MHRRLSTLVKPFGNNQISDGQSSIDDETASKLSTVIEDPPTLTPPNLRFKRLDYYYSKWGKQWKYRTMSAKVSVEPRPLLKTGDNDPWKDFCFVVVRTVPKVEDQFNKPSFKVVIKSEYIIKACKEVIQKWPGISWNTEPLELDPDIFITFLPKFIDYRDELSMKKNSTLEDQYLLSSVNVLLDWMHSDYSATINAIRKLTSHGEITWDLLHAILVPQSILIAQCAVTGEPRAFKLESFSRTALDGVPIRQLVCQSVDTVDRPTSNTIGVGRVRTLINLRYFKGPVKISSLDAFPIEYHPAPMELRRSLIERGKKWLALSGIHHKQYRGVAAVKVGNKLEKHNVHSRVMIDRATFKKLKTGYIFPTPVPAAAAEVPNPNTNNPNIPLQSPQQAIPPGTLPANQNFTVQGMIPDEEEDLTDDDLLLASAVVYGFSLSDKTWLEFNVQKIVDVDWNDDAFANLVIPSGHKTLLQSLIEAHHKVLGFDDFIKGKGQGLVINLFGPPGVGKTFTAEATSEHVRRPLYVVGAGDLGTTAIELDKALAQVFDVATTWKAIVLIDEADVFLEQRSLHDLERNAMVAVFLRHLEYYRGIIFLTTNRVKAFDEAFLSRIHLALHFNLLSVESKTHVWRAFLSKAGAHITEEQLQYLASRNVNGRQIKNATKTAHSLAVGKGEEMSFGHLVTTLDAMDDFTTQFEAIKVAGATQ